MKKTFIILLLAVVLPAFIGCSSTSTENTSQPPPRNAKKHLKKQKRLNVPFAAIDADGNQLVDWKEFKAHFPKGRQKMFKKLDKNKDKFIGPGEWRAFRVKRGFIQ